MWFIFALILSVLSLAGSAAFFSIYGLAKIYSGTFWATVIMGASIEYGKLISISLLYRYWKEAGIILKSYLFSAIFISMIVTSIGIYGFLTSSYQQDSIPLQEIESKTMLLTNEKDELLERRKQIDIDISRISPDHITKRMQLIDKYAPERTRIDKRVVEITTEIQTLSSNKIQQQVHTGPIIYIAKAFGKEVDDAIVILTLLIMIVFDPMAVALTIGLNMVLLKRLGTKKEGADVESLKKQKEEIEESLTLLQGLATDLKEKANLSVGDLQIKLKALNGKSNLSEEELKQKSELESILSQSARKEDILKKIRKKPT